MVERKNRASRRFKQMLLRMTTRPTAGRGLPSPLARLRPPRARRVKKPLSRARDQQKSVVQRR
eukprot:800229-Alexandrium_andersonii.AAC.1